MSEVEYKMEANGRIMVGASGFEPPTSASRTLRAKPSCATPRKILYNYRLI